LTVDRPESTLRVGLSHIDRILGEQVKDSQRWLLCQYLRGQKLEERSACGRLGTQGVRRPRGGRYTPNV
jgi:hypothetical protein